MVSPQVVSVVASRELWGVPTGAESRTVGLVKLADINMKWRFVRERSGFRRKYILTNQRAGNYRCGTVMDAFRKGNFDIKQTGITILFGPNNIRKTGNNWTYVFEIWSVYDSTDMLYGPEFEGWELSNWRAKPVSWRVNLIPRQKTNQIQGCQIFKHELPQ